MIKWFFQEKRKETKANLGALFAPRAPEQNLDDLEYERLYYFDDLKQVSHNASLHAKILPNPCTVV